MVFVIARKLMAKIQNQIEVISVFLPYKSFKFLKNGVMDRR